MLDSARLLNILKKSFRFCLVGALGTAVYFLCTWFLVEITHISVLWAVCIGFCLVTVQNYFLHYGWTFQSQRKHASTFPRFVVMNVVGFFLNLVLMHILVNKYGIDYRLAQIGTIVVVLAWNACLSAGWIFTTRHVEKKM